MERREKISRFNCAKCLHVTLAPLGVLNVRCENPSCGANIGETAMVLDCLRTLFREKEALLVGHAPLSTKGDMRPILVAPALATEGDLGLAGF